MRRRTVIARSVRIKAKTRIEFCQRNYWIEAAGLEGMDQRFFVQKYFLPSEVSTKNSLLRECQNLMKRRRGENEKIKEEEIFSARS